MKWILMPFMYLLISLLSSITAAAQTKLENATAPPKLGHGHTPMREIDTLIARYEKNPVVHAAVDIIRGADWADFLDIQLLSNFIKDSVGKKSSSSATSSEVKAKLTHDRILLSQALKNCETCSAPFKYSLKLMAGDSDTRGAMRHAMDLLNSHPELTLGQIPLELQSVKGWKLLALRTSLFFVAKKRNPRQFDNLVRRLNGFYSSSLEGGPFIHTLLENTLFFRNEELLIPACSYISMAYKSKKIVNSSNNLTNSFSINFTDCSGFVLHVLSQLFPDDDYFKERRDLASYHFAALFDALANDMNKSETMFYDGYGKALPLTAPEKYGVEKIREFPYRFQKLRSVLEPVIDFRKLKTGDIIIKRHKYGFNDPLAPEGNLGADGHMFIVVNPTLPNPTCVELTAGSTLGYGWTKTTLKSADDFRYRVLRIKK